MHEFKGKYMSVRRFVKALRRKEPERFDVLEYGPGEEAQVDYGQGAPTVYQNGKQEKLYLFVMTFKYSGKSFRKVVWRTNQQVWAKLHEEAFRSFGGCPQTTVAEDDANEAIDPESVISGEAPIRSAPSVRLGIGKP
jgi:transposase